MRINKSVKASSETKKSNKYRKILASIDALSDEIRCEIDSEDCEDKEFLKDRLADTFVIRSEIESKGK